MKRKSRQITYTVSEDRDELPPDEAALLEKAWEAIQHSYAPYSRFRVGCAVLLEGGEIVLGSNQENRAYPSGMCAERNALFHIGAMGKTQDIRKIAIRATSERKNIDEPAMPCGGCRQVMVECEQLSGIPFVVLSQGETGPVMRVEGIQDTLMPFSFDLDF